MLKQCNCIYNRGPFHTFHGQQLAKITARRQRRSGSLPVAVGPAWVPAGVRPRLDAAPAHASLIEGDKWSESAAVRPMAPPAHYYVVCSGYTRSRSMGPPPRAEQSRAGG